MRGPDAPNQELDAPGLTSPRKLPPPDWLMAKTMQLNSLFHLPA
jgi:hypothetical protein